MNLDVEARWFKYREAISGGTDEIREHCIRVN